LGGIIRNVLTSTETIDIILGVGLLLLQLFHAGIAQSVVRRIGSAEVTSSILVASFTVKMAETQCL
jgi:hypothetical protein